MKKATHELKIWPEFFEGLEAPPEKRKTFDVRRIDRKYAVGDMILFREWEPKTARYSGRECKRKISYILEGVGSGCIEPLQGIYRGYAVLGFESEV